MQDNLLTEEDESLNIPEKFKDPDTGKLRLKTLLDSYAELERRLSKSPAVPATHAEYCVDCSHGLFSSDEDINRRLHERGFSQEQAQLVYDLAAERMVPMVTQLAGDFQADREIERLIVHFGGEEKWKEVSRQLLAFGRRQLPPDVLDNMAASYEGVLALYRMMKGEEPGLRRKDAAVTGPEGAESEMELHGMMRDPRYWRDRDPAFVNKVTQGFQRMYGRN